MQLHIRLPHQPFLLCLVFPTKNTVCICVFSVFIFCVSSPSFQHASHAVMSLTRKAPSFFVSAESLGSRTIGGFRVNLHHHRKELCLFNYSEVRSAKPLITYMLANGSITKVFICSRNEQSISFRIPPATAIPLPKLWLLEQWHDFQGFGKCH